MNWASSQIITEVSKFLMEQGYGCTVEKVPSATTTSMASLAENGEPDIVTELWLNSTGDVYAKLEEEGKVARMADVFDPGGVEGWWIPDYLAQAHPELSTIEGVLANPDLVGGRFNSCPDGWGCRIVNDNLITALGMRDSMEVFDHGSGETLATSIAAAYENQEPWFGYYWGPTAVLGKIRDDQGGDRRNRCRHSHRQPEEGRRQPRCLRFPACPGPDRRDDRTVGA